MDYCTDSVINFFKSNPYILINYFELVEQLNENISYSGLLQVTKLNGTTSEGVNFETHKVCRSDVTKFLRKCYVEYMNSGCLVFKN